MPVIGKKDRDGGCGVEGQPLGFRVKVFFLSVKFVFEGSGTVVEGQISGIRAGVDSVAFSVQGCGLQG